MDGKFSKRDTTDIDEFLSCLRRTDACWNISKLLGNDSRAGEMWDTKWTGVDYMSLAFGDSLNKLMGR